MDHEPTHSVLDPLLQIRLMTVHDAVITERYGAFGQGELRHRLLGAGALS